MKSILWCSFWGKHSLSSTPTRTKVAPKLLVCTCMTAEEVPALFVAQNERGSGGGNQRDTTQTQTAPCPELLKARTGLVIAEVTWERHGAERIWRTHKWNVWNISLMSLIELLSLINITIQEVEVLVAQSCRTFCDPMDQGKGKQPWIRHRCIWVSVLGLQWPGLSVTEKIQSRVV